MEESASILQGKVEPIFEAYAPASEQEISSAEHAIGIQLPALLRDIQRKFGRCMLSGDAVVRVWGFKELGIATLFGLKGEAGNLVADYERHPDLRANGLVPFADDFFNNRFSWKVETSEVWFIDYSHDRATRRVAPSLSEFFRNIVVRPD